MTALKAYQVEEFIRKKSTKSGIYLVYGSDTGLIYERSITLATNGSNGSCHDTSSSDIVVLDMAELEADPSRLAVEALTTSMFGSSPTIRIRGGNKKLVPTLEEILKTKLSATIIIQAGNLTRHDKLRMLIEKDKNSWALPCFSDDKKSLKELVEKSFENKKIIASPEAISYLTTILGNDRDITRRELEKLHNFALESKKISLRDIQDLCGDNSMITIDKILDATGTGNVQNLEVALNSAFIAGIDAQSILAAGSRHFMFLRTVRAKMDSGSSASAALIQTYPKPHFSRSHAIELQLRNWSQKSLAKVIHRLLDATLDSRQNNSLGSVIARRAFLGICIAASRY